MYVLLFILVQTPSGEKHSEKSTTGWDCATETEVYVYDGREGERNDVIDTYVMKVFHNFNVTLMSRDGVLLCKFAVTWMDSLSTRSQTFKEGDLLHEKTPASRQTTMSCSLDFYIVRTHGLFQEPTTGTVKISQQRTQLTSELALELLCKLVERFISFDFRSLAVKINSVSGLCC